jgi:dTDP-glucose 4,6-dehydratase
MARKLSNIAVTGGSGFIGSNFIRHLMRKTDFTGRIINIDKLTYAGNPENLEDIDKAFGDKRYFFEQSDICNYDDMFSILRKYDIDTIVHFAAESHVDRSIFGQKAFIETNILGTFNLLEAARAFWKDAHDVLFHHVSTDEVFGSLGESGFFTEKSPYDPKSPYSASKASSDHLVRATGHTYGFPFTISNCSNNYGPYQFPEKMIPLMILNILSGKSLPVYGDGGNVRDWLFVEDHAEAIWRIISEGRAGETYNIGGNNEWKNLDLVHLLCDEVSRQTGEDKEHYTRLIAFVKDRPGHDRRYAIDCAKITNSLGFIPRTGFEQGIGFTVKWYMENRDWTERIRSGEYQNWISKNYDLR